MDRWCGTGRYGQPVRARHRPRPSDPDRSVNNVHVFPGVGLGVVATQARAVSDAMFTAAATTIGDLAARNTDGGLLPPITESRNVAREVALAVARAGIDEGLAEPLTDVKLAARIDSTAWHPAYRELTAGSTLPGDEAPDSTS